jgi:hypothetical protein
VSYTELKWMQWLWFYVSVMGGMSCTKLRVGAVALVLRICKGWDGLYRTESGCSGSGSTYFHLSGNNSCDFMSKGTNVLIPSECV